MKYINMDRQQSVLCGWLTIGRKRDAMGGCIWTGLELFVQLAKFSPAKDSWWHHLVGPWPLHQFTSTTFEDVRRMRKRIDVSGLVLFVLCVGCSNSLEPTLNPIMRINLCHIDFQSMPNLYFRISVGHGNWTFRKLMWLIILVYATFV